MVDVAELQSAFADLLGERASDWTVEWESSADIFTVTLSHPASAGLAFDIEATAAGTAAAIAASTLRNVPELDIVAAAPEVLHERLVQGVRTLTRAFGWTNVEVRSVVFLLWECDLLTHDEAGWLAGYEGASAPFAHRFPTDIGHR